MSVPLDEFFAIQDWKLPADLNDWEVKKEGELVYLSLSAKDGERYRVRFNCEGYPEKAPSVVFVNEKGDKTDGRAWPVGKGSFHEVVKVPQACFLCMPLTKEGLQQHPNWVGDPAVMAWAPKNNLLDLFNYLQRLLNGHEYDRRGP